jgi:hypothetical protein
VSEDTKQKGISNKKKLGIAAGVVAAAGLVAGAIFTKGKTLSPANFAEHIEFSPAKTMEEAAAFAKKHLGIQNFNLGDDVEMANWVNKALTNINNRFKGKAQMPKNVNFGEEIFAKHPDWAAFHNAKTETIGVNKAVFDNSFADLNKLIEEGKVAAEKIRKNDPKATLDDLLLSVLDGKVKYINDKEFVFNPSISWIDHELQKSIVAQLTKYKADPKSLSRFEAYHLLLKIEDLAAAQEKLLKEPLVVIKRIAKDQPEFFKQNFKDISYYESLPKDKQAIECYHIMSKTAKNKNVQYAFVGAKRGASLYSTIYHEMGHLLHNMNSSMKDYLWGVLSNKSFENFLKSSDKLKTADKISEYAQTNPLEFVAETFSALCAGKKLPDEVMEMYKYYKGPMIPNM